MRSEQCCESTSLRMATTIIKMMSRTRMTTEPKNVIPFAELSTLELMVALTIPSPSNLEAWLGVWQLLDVATWP